MTTAAARPRLRVRMTREGRAELRALGRSVLAHLAFLLVLVVADWLNRIPWSSPVTVRVGLVPASALPAPAPSRPRENLRPRPSSPPPVVTPPEPERPEPPRVDEVPPEPELPGLEPPAPTATAPRPRPTAPAARPRPSAPRPSEPQTADEPDASPSAHSSPSPTLPAGVKAGIAGALEGWEGGPGDPYLEALIRRVSSKWLKPTSGLPPRPATIYFVIDRRGRVSGLRVEASSGASMFDRAALRAVDLSSPLPPIPSGVRTEELKVHLDFLP